MAEQYKRRQQPEKPRAMRAIEIQAMQVFQHFQQNRHDHQHARQPRRRAQHTQQHRRQERSIARAQHRKQRQHQEQRLRARYREKQRQRRKHHQYHRAPRRPLAMLRAHQPEQRPARHQQRQIRHQKAREHIMPEAQKRKKTHQIWIKRQIIQHIRRGRIAVARQIDVARRIPAHPVADRRVKQLVQRAGQAAAHHRCGQYQQPAEQHQAQYPHDQVNLIVQRPLVAL